MYQYCHTPDCKESKELNTESLPTVFYLSHTDSFQESTRIVSSEIIVITLFCDLSEIFGESLDSRFMRTNQEHPKSWDS